MKLRTFKALVDEKGMDDIGASGLTFEVDQLVKGKIYTQADERNYCEVNYVRKPFFVDDNGCSRDIADNIKKGIIEEVFISDCKHSIDSLERNGDEGYCHTCKVVKNI